MLYHLILIQHMTFCLQYFSHKWFSNYITLQMQMPEQAMLRVCDIKGAVLFEGAFTGQEMDIPTGNWSNGTYFCSLIDPRGTLEVKQFNIQR